MNKIVICVGGPFDGWEGSILHGRKIMFFKNGPVEYRITDNLDEKRRRIAVYQSNEEGVKTEGEIYLAASEGAAYAYPGEDQQELRQAFCDGAVYVLTGKLPK